MNISKKGQILLFPPPLLNDYLVVVAAPEMIQKDIKKNYDKLHKIIGTTEKEKFKAHIALFPQAWEKDNHLLERLKKAVADVKAFSILLNGVGAFPNGTKKKTLHLKVENPKPIQQIYEECKSELKLKKEFIPHLVIEKNLTNTDFEKVEADLSIFNHQCEWICDRITVLKFNKKNSSYKLVEEIMLL